MTVPQRLPVISALTAASWRTHRPMGRNLFFQFDLRRQRWLALGMAFWWLPDQCLPVHGKDHPPQSLASRLAFQAAQGAGCGHDVVA